MENLTPLAALSGCDPPTDEAEDALPLSDAARMTLLDRIEAWIEEEERLITEIERKIAAASGDAPGPWACAYDAPEPDDSYDCQGMTAELCSRLNSPEITRERWR